MITQINTQETIKKEFINIFEISLLFEVSGITARRHIHEILNEIKILEDKMKLADQGDQALINQKLSVLSGKVRRRIVGQTKTGEDIFILELAKKEALEKWELRPATKAALQKTPEQATQTTGSPVKEMNQPAQEIVQETAQEIAQTAGRESNQNSLPKTERYETPNLVTDIYGQKYISLLETQLTEKDNTIKDLRETNKFLSITNSKLNEQLKFLLERPAGPVNPPENAG